MKSVPPRFARRVLAAVVPADEREAVLGDLAEQFARRARQEGVARARRWYRGQVARSVWPMLTYPGRWRRMTMVGLLQDLRLGFRVFRRFPGFAAVVVATLALGVGGASAVYSVVRGVLLTPLPFDDPDRVVMLWGQSAEYPRAPLTVGDHNVLAEDVEAFAEVTGAWSNNALILGEGEAEQVNVGWVTHEYFDLLGIEPLMGRTMEPLEEGAVVLSHGLWARRYGSDPGMVGRMIDLGGQSFEVVGVLPADRDPNLTTFAATRATHQVWRLMPEGWIQGDDRSVGWIRSTARLKDGVSLAQAQAEVAAVIQRVNETITDRDGGTDMTVRLVPVRADLVGDVSRTLWILLAAVVGVLLIAASNVAHLVLARGEVRAGEVAVRSALGGSRGRLIRQMIVENAVLAGAGGAAGVLLAWVGMDVLLTLAPPKLPRLDAVAFNWSVFGFALLATVAASLVFAVVPALRATRTDLSEALGARTSTPDPRQQRLSRGLVVAEVAMSLALVTSTGLLLKSFASLHQEELGFDREGVVTFALEAPEWGESGEEAAATTRAYLDQVSAVPGVVAAGFTNRVPLGGGLFTGGLRSEEMVGAEVDPIRTSVRWVTPDYFEAMGARVLAGRSFLPEEGVDRVLIDRVAAERLWPGGDAVGRRVEVSAIGGDPALVEVVGLVEPMKHAGVRQAAAETVYFPLLGAANQTNFRFMAVRVAGSPEAALEPLRRAVRSVHNDAVVARVRTMQQLFDDDVAATRFATLLLSAFGAVALLLATVGLHGVMAFSVRRRAREIGIRVVLGAEHGRILLASVRAGAGLVVAGIVLGTVLSLGIGRLIQSQLFGVEPGDPATLAAAAALMMIVGLVGAYLPARLVLGVDPAVTLREE